jgi:hypothetical protein
MVETKWMDFSGAPPILMPERLLDFWGGFYLPADENDTADLTLPNGRAFCVQDDFDFKHPKTDYDRLCARAGGHFLHPVGPGQALGISDYSDGTVGWWPEQQMLITVSQHLPDPAGFELLEWKDEVIWQIPDAGLILMNSCLHGADPDKPQDQFVEIDLQPGKYSITAADYSEGICVMLYRFRRVS